MNLQIPRAIAVTLALAAALAVARGATLAAQAPVASCDPIGPLKFVCGQAGPEDLVAVPDSRFLIASAFGGEGGLFLLDTRAATSTKLYPSATAAHRLDAATYAACPGPPQTTPRFQTHGLFLKPGTGGRHTLLVVGHGNRESVEVFELDTRGASPAVTWVGCAVAPDPIGLNSVLALPEGGFVATNFQSRAPAGRAGGGFSSALVNGENNGELWEWQPRAGWTKVPGSEAAGANGLELSKDGKWFYVAQWGSKSFMRVSRGQTPVKRDVLSLGFRVDNVRWAPDGTLLVAGQGGPDCAALGQARGTGPCNGVATSTIGKVDPEKWTYTQLVDYPTTSVISAATVAIQVGNELWAGSFRGDRVTRYPVAGVR
ncbi:MAG TPA: hypothetical protein VIY56_16210 [Vicinamibacterales bacterium]